MVTRHPCPKRNESECAVATRPMSEKKAKEEEEEEEEENEHGWKN
jgi:hypothetical protein